MTISSLSTVLGLSRSGVWIVLVVAGMLAGAALLRWAAERRYPDEETGRAWRSIVTWWILFTILLLVLVSGPVGVLLVTGTVSLLLLAETLRLVDRVRLFPVLATGAVGLYVWAWLDWRTVYTVFLPAAAAVAAVWEVGSRAALSADIGMRRPVLHYPILVAMIGPAYVFATVALPAPTQAPRGAMGWFLLLVVLTELNDMAQAWWGRALGSKPLAPRISPGKTWEGLVGGLVTTSVVALMLCPALTSWGRMEPPGLQLGWPAWIWSIGLGLVVASSGVAGDLAASALKRRAGLKDAGALLPGHGGVLDRFDSIAATAPAYFLLTWTLWFWTP